MATFGNIFGAKNQWWPEESTTYVNFRRHFTSFAYTNVPRTALRRTSRVRKRSETVP
jgi:hypothetical protein